MNKMNMDELYKYMGKIMLKMPFLGGIMETSEGKQV